MQAVEIQSHARKMLEAHGAQAILEAIAQGEDLRAGRRQTTGASDWRRIESALRLMRGPRET